MLSLFGFGLPLPAPIMIWAGPLIFFSGLWGQLSSERMTCDLRRRTYTRREGQGLFKQVIQGSLDELDAIVLLTEVGGLVSRQETTYRLVLHWKNQQHPLLVIGSESYTLVLGQINAKAGNLAAKGAFYARALGVPFYDNSYFPSPEPLRPI